jgi:hypothetical protein
LRLIRCPRASRRPHILPPRARAIDVSVRSDAPATTLPRCSISAQRRRPHPVPQHPAPTASSAASVRAREGGRTGGVRARQQHRRPARPPDRRTSPHRVVGAAWLRPMVARHHAVDRRPPRAPGERTPTSSASRSIPAVIILSPSCTDTRQLYLWGPTPTDKVNSFTRKGIASASDCWRWC